MRIHVCITHYAAERSDSDNPIGNGSLRAGAQFQRSLSLSRCLQGLIAIQRQANIVSLNIHKRCIEHYPANHEPLDIQITICTDGSHQLDGVLSLFKSRTKQITLITEDPRDLGLACRDHLLSNRSGADLLMYMEDDLVINDPDFFDKQSWFLNKTNHQFCLMPHRYETIHAAGMHHLLVDGPLAPDFIKQFTQPQRHVAQGTYREKDNINFDIPGNPHSGCFVISSQQAEYLSQQKLPRDGFVGPLETAATLTVLQHFPVMKPSIENWRFLEIEHAHQSFSGYINSMPHQSFEISENMTSSKEQV